MEFKEIRCYNGKFEVWAKWDSDCCYDKLGIFPFNDLIEEDKEKAEFLANELANLIKYKHIDETYKIHTERTDQLKEIVNEELENYKKGLERIYGNIFGEKI